MANVIDIVIRAQDQATAALKRVEGEVGSLSKSVGTAASTVNALGVLAPVLIGAAVAAVNAARSFGEMAEQLGRVAERTGLSKTDLQVYRAIIEDAGGSAESLTQALTFLNRAIATQDPILAKLGITTKDTKEAFQQLVTILAQSDDVAKKTEIAYQLLGRGSAELIADFGNLATGFDRSKARMLASGQILSDGMIDQGKRIDDQFDRLGRNWAAIANRMSAVSGGLVAIQIKNWSDDLEWILRLTTGFRNLKGAVDDYSGVVDKLGQHLGHMLPSPLIDPNDKKKDKNGLSLAEMIEQQRVQGTRDLVPTVQREIGRQQLGLDQLEKARDLFANSLPVMVQQWQDSMAQMTDAGTVFGDTMSGIFDSLETSLTTTFEHIVLEGKLSFADLENAVRGMVDAVLRELARLAAAKIAASIAGVAASIIGGIFGLGAPIGLGLAAAGGAGVSAGFPNASRGDVGPRNTTININAIDARSVADQMLSPFGAFRVADQRMQTRRDWR